MVLFINREANVTITSNIALTYTFKNLPVILLGINSGIIQVVNTTGNNFPAL